MGLGGLISGGNPPAAFLPPAWPDPPATWSRVTLKCKGLPPWNGDPGGRAQTPEYLLGHRRGLCAWSPLERGPWSHKGPGSGQTLHQTRQPECSGVADTAVGSALWRTFGERADQALLEGPQPLSLEIRPESQAVGTPVTPGEFHLLRVPKCTALTQGSGLFWDEEMEPLPFSWGLLRVPLSPNHHHGYEMTHCHQNCLGLGNA